MQNYEYQDLSIFRLPVNFRGRNVLMVQAWWMVQSSLFQWSPQFAYGFRRFLLRLFGAKIGQGVIVRPSVRFTYPWKVYIGDNSWIGDNVVLYSLGEIHIGDNAVISQQSYLCAGDHDYAQVDFPIRARPIRVESECWIAAGTFVGPGVTVGRASVVGARSTVTADLPPKMVCVGSPCKPVHLRVLS